MRELSKEAFGKIYDQHWAMVYTHAFKYLGNEDLAKDLAQDLFVKVWEKRHELNILHLEAYLKGSVRNAVYDRAKKKHTHVSFFDVMEQLVAPDVSDGAVISKELQEAYVKVLKEMPERRKQIFHMRYEEQLSTLQIAERLKISRKTVQNQLINSFNDLATFLGAIVALLLI